MENHKIYVHCDMTMQDICSALGIWEDLPNESNGYDKVSTMNEFANSITSTEDLQMHSVQQQSDTSVSSNNLETDNTLNLSFSSDFHSSENSNPKISTQDIFIDGLDYESNKNFDEVEHSVLSQHVGSNQNMGGSLDRASSKPTLVETLVSSINSDTKPKYTILNALIYEELTPLFTLPPILESKGSMLISYNNESTSILIIK